MQTTLGLIKNECANHDNEMNNIKNHCCIGAFYDYQCQYFVQDGFRCDYFEKSVLPLDKQLEAIYYAEISAKGNNRELSSKEKKQIKEQNKETIECLKCKEEFKPASNRQKYCKKCTKENNKEKTRIRNREYRENKILKMTI